MKVRVGALPVVLRLPNPSSPPPLPLRSSSRPSPPGTDMQREGGRREGAVSESDWR